MSSGTSSRKRRAAGSEQVASSSKGADAEILASSSKSKATSDRSCTEVANGARSSAHVPGSKMSAAKHSGLLAHDVACTVAEEEVGAKIPRIQLASVRVADENGGITGRQLYAIAPRRSIKARPATENDSQRPQAPSSTRPTSTQKEVPQEGKGKRRRPVEEPDDSEESDYQLSEDDADCVAKQLNRAGGGGEADIAEFMLEDYFSAHGGGAGPTSDHTLARLACPQMDAAAVRSALQAAPQAFHEDFRTLYEEHLNLFSYWLFQMSAGFNILLYGLGSKRELIEGFRSKKLAGSTHLVVNGYFPGLTVKQVLHTLSCDLLGQVGTFKNHSEHAKSICRVLEENQDGEEEGDRCVKEVFLIVHNIDGPSLRSEKAQTPLSILAQSPHIRVVASIDHINASLIWDQGRLSRFNWLWHDVTTYEPYMEETSYENSLMVKQSGTLALSGLRHVLQSLTPNAQGIFKLIVGHHLECGSQTGYQGFPFHDCYLQCRERFLVNSELTLRTQLTEFCDHKLVRCRHGNDGVEYLLVAVDSSTLVEFLEEEEKKG